LQLLLIEELIKGKDDNLKRIYELIKGSFSFDNIKQDEISIDDEFDTTGKIKLDASKIEVLKAILNLKDGEILLVVGPPGTGKTTLIAKAAEMLAKKGEKVLIACHTNLAIDNAISLLKRDLDFTLRIGVPEKISKDVGPIHAYV
jgi:SRP54-type protein, GTPase domain.